MKNILFVTCVNSEYPVQLLAARELGKHPLLNVIFCFNSVANNLYKELQECMQEGFRAIELIRSDGSANTNITTYRMEGQQAQKPRPTLSLFFSQLKRRKAIMARCRHYIRHFSIDLVIVSNNKADFLMPYLVRAVHLEGKKVVMLPFGMESARSYLLKVAQGENSLLKGNLYNRLLAPFLGKWIFRSASGERRICMPVQEALIMRLLKAAPHIPVSPYGGKADLFLAENSFMYRFYSSLVASSTKLVNTGAPYNDILAQVLSNRQQAYERLCRQYDVAKGKKLIVVSLPQYMPAFWSRATEYGSYPDFVARFFQSLSEVPDDYHVFVSVHPRINALPIMQQAAVFRNISMATDYIAALIPLCEYYICSESSTSRMAIACNKPVINYDLYHFNFCFFSEHEGVATVHSEADFRKLLEAFCRKDDMFCSCRERQKKVQHEFLDINASAADNIRQQVLALLK